MDASERIRLIKGIVGKLAPSEYTDVDLTLRQFDLPTTDFFEGTRDEYVVSMIDKASDEKLTKLARHLGVRLSDATAIVPRAKLSDLIVLVNAQKATMISVATGGPRIQQVNTEYTERRARIRALLEEISREDPNSFADLWIWYGKWSDGSLPSYQSRRLFITNMYQPLLDALSLAMAQTDPAEAMEPTGWERVDRTMARIPEVLHQATTEEEFQSVGLLCREVMISLGQAVYDPGVHEPFDGVQPSETDAKRLLESFIAAELAGGSNEEQRAFVKTAYRLATRLQHLRTADLRAAALCYESTRALVNSVAIIAGRRDR